MKFRKRRRLRKLVKSFNFHLYLKRYGYTGEYMAWDWLKAYVEGRACSEPLSLVKSVLNGPCVIDQKQKDYLSTLLNWVD